MINRVNNSYHNIQSNNISYDNNNPSSNISYDNNNNNNNIKNEENNINNSLNPNSFSYNKYIGKNLTDFLYSRQNLENNKIRFKLLKNVRDEIEDINFKNKVKNNNTFQTNYINNNNKNLKKQNSNNNVNLYNNSCKIKRMKENNNFNDYITGKMKRNKKNEELLKNYYLTNKNNNKEIASKKDPLKININKNSHNQTYFYYKEKSQTNNENVDDYNKENNNYILNDNNAMLYKNNSKDKNIDIHYNKTINNDILNKINLLNNDKRNIEVINENRKKNNSKNQKDKNLKEIELFIQNFLQLKGFSCLEELINWIIKVKQYKNFITKIKNIYLSSNYNNNIDKNVYYNDILSWINQNNININNNKKMYGDYCKEIMKNNNLTNIEEFKEFTNQILNKNKQNSEFLKEMKEIFLHNFVSKTINGKNYKEIPYNNNIFLNE